MAKIISAALWFVGLFGIPSDFSVMTEIFQSFAKIVNSQNVRIGIFVLGVFILLIDTLSKHAPFARVIFRIRRYLCSWKTVSHYAVDDFVNRWPCAVRDRSAESDIKLAMSQAEIIELIRGGSLKGYLVGDKGAKLVQLNAKTILMLPVYPNEVTSTYSDRIYVCSWMVPIARWNSERQLRAVREVADAI